MDQVPKLASFIRYNMPQNNRGSLSSQQAYDLAAYITEQPRPQLDQQAGYVLSRRTTSCLPTLSILLPTAAF